MDKRHIALIIRQWWWLVVLTALAAGIITYVVSVRQPAVYRASVRLIVGPGIDSPSPDLNDLRAGAQLMQTYAELPQTGPFLQAIIDELDLSVQPEILAESMNITSNSETQILTVDVNASNPTDAVRIANAVAANLVRISPSGGSSQAGLLNQRMQQQADQVASSITVIEERIATLEEQLAEATSLEQQAAISSELSQERERLTATHSTLTALYESIQQAATNQVKIIEPAGGAEPVLSMLWLKVAIGLVSGLIGSLGLVLAYEYFVDTIDTPEELGRAIAGSSGSVPVLGAIARHQPLYGKARDRLVVEALPNSPAAENYRTLGIKLGFSQQPTMSRVPGPPQEPGRSVLLSSLATNHDVGELAANLAVVLSQTGKHVVLVDANLYNPSLGDHFGIGADRLGHGRCGLTEVLKGKCKYPDLFAVEWAPGLSVLSTGEIEDNSFRRLASPAMVDLLHDLEQRADIVLVAGSPLSVYADSLFLASRVDGVILASRSGITRRKTVQDAVQSLNSVGAKILGAILHDSRRAGWADTAKAAGSIFPNLAPGRATAAAGAAGRQPERVVDETVADGMQPQEAETEVAELEPETVAEVEAALESQSPRPSDRPYDTEL
jgi:Mrp family chromosome partitioning ATPase